MTKHLVSGKGTRRDVKDLARVSQRHEADEPLRPRRRPRATPCSTRSRSSGPRSTAARLARGPARRSISTRRSLRRARRPGATTLAPTSSSEERAMTEATKPTFSMDGRDIPFEPGQTILQAAMAAGVYVPHLCFHAEFKPHGSCKVCTVKVNGRTATSCTTPARAGRRRSSRRPPRSESCGRTSSSSSSPRATTSARRARRAASCTLQAVAYELEVTSPHYNPLFPDRPVDASHPDVLLDFNRCILCELCIRASSAGRREERVRALGSRHHEAPHRQRRVRAARGHRRSRSTTRR